MSAVDVVPASLSADNPLSNASPLAFALPPFAGISAEHCREALLAGMAEQRAEIAVIADSAEVPTFENTVVALERSGELLTRAWSVFANVTSSVWTPRHRGLEFLRQRDVLGADAAAAGDRARGRSSGGGALRCHPPRPGVVRPDRRR